MSDWNDVEVQPEELIRLMRDPGTVAEQYDAMTIIVCDGVSVLRVNDHGLVEQACVDPRHGCHPRYAVVAEQVTATLKKLGVNAADEPVRCPQCYGVGWIDIDEPLAVRVRVMALAFEIFRGIKIPIPDTEDRSQVKQELIQGAIASMLGEHISSISSEPVTDPRGSAGEGDTGRPPLSTNENNQAPRCRDQGED
jgi:hypothetical protein